MTSPVRVQRTESDVQRAICQHRQEPIFVPNCTTIFGWESDLVSVTRAGLCHDFEIKTRRSDFLREFGTSYKAGRYGSKRWRRMVLLGETQQYGDYARPNYFWVAVTDDVCSPEEIPSYAGLISFAEEQITTLVQAPRLHTSKLEMTHYRALATGLTARLWARHQGHADVLLELANKEAE